MAAPHDLYVLESDDGRDAPTVVFVHGAMDRSSSFGRMVRHLGDLHVVRYDRRGYGRSTEAPLGSLGDHVDDLLGVIGERPVVVFGHSIGGVIALVAASRRPDLIRSLVAYEAPTPWVPWWPSAPKGAEVEPEDEAEAFMRRAIGDRIWARLPKQTRADRRAEGRALRADIASVTGTEPFDPAAVVVPVIVASGADTTWWHVRGADELAEELPHSIRVVVPEAQHAVHLSHATASSELVRQALAAAGPGQPAQR